MQLFDHHDASHQGPEKLYLFRSHSTLALKTLVAWEAAADCLDVVALG